jgi:hypothetical protein
MAGSLRVYLCRADAARLILPAVRALLAHERDIGFEDIRSYERFSARVHHTKRQLLSFLGSILNFSSDWLDYGVWNIGHESLLRA